MLKTLTRELLSITRSLPSTVHAIRLRATVAGEHETECMAPAEEKDKLYKKLELELKGNEKMVMKSYAKFTIMVAEHLDIKVGASFSTRRHDLERYTVLRSAFVHKKHRVQYEFRTYYRVVNFHHLTGSTLSTFLEYIERNLPEGVALKATKVELMELPEHLKEPPTFEDQ